VVGRRARTLTAAELSPFEQLTDPYAPFPAALADAGGVRSLRHRHARQAVARAMARDEVARSDVCARFVHLERAQLLRVGERVRTCVGDSLWAHGVVLRTHLYQGHARTAAAARR
jgi:hypothetical protein